MNPSRQQAVPVRMPPRHGSRPGEGTGAGSLPLARRRRLVELPFRFCATPLVFDRAEGAYLYDLDGNRPDRLLSRHGADDPRSLPGGPSRRRQLRNWSAASFTADRVGSRLKPPSCSAPSSLAPRECAFADRDRRPCRLAVPIGAGRDRAHHRGASSRAIITAGSTTSSCRARSPAPMPGPRTRPFCAGQQGAGSLSAWPGTEVLSWNDLAAVEARLANRDVAALIMEPAMCNSGAIPPAPGYLEGARARARAHGALLIFDEVITGFRLAPRRRPGAASASRLDLATFGKCLANGFPVAAVSGAGRSDRLCSRRRRPRRHLQAASRSRWRRRSRPCGRWPTVRPVRHSRRRADG